MIWWSMHLPKWVIPLNDCFSINIRYHSPESHCLYSDSLRKLICPHSLANYMYYLGGPGCSSELAVFYENGPFQINENLTLRENPYGWDKAGSIIYVDQVQLSYLFQKSLFKYMSRNLLGILLNLLSAGKKHAFWTGIISSATHYCFLFPIEIVWTETRESPKNVNR